jgi:hypothetical protein
MEFFLRVKSLNIDTRGTNKHVITVSCCDFMFKQLQFFVSRKSVLYFRLLFKKHLCSWLVVCYLFR